MSPSSSYLPSSGLQVLWLDFGSSVDTGEQTLLLLAMELSARPANAGTDATKTSAPHILRLLKLLRGLQHACLVSNNRCCHISLDLTP
jgi:hypothetical protein